MMRKNGTQIRKNGQKLIELLDFILQYAMVTRITVRRRNSEAAPGKLGSEPKMKNNSPQ